MRKPVDYGYNHNDVEYQWIKIEAQLEQVCGNSGSLTIRWNIQKWHREELKNVDKQQYRGNDKMLAERKRERPWHNTHTQAKVTTG